MPLSPVGEAQAAALARALEGARFERIYASDLSRAYATARAIARPHALEVVGDIRLREFDFGAWEGLTWEQIVATQPHLRAAGKTAARQFAPERGERFETVCARVAAFLSELRTVPVRRVAIVTHAGILHALAQELGIEPEPGSIPFTFRPASISRVSLNPNGARLTLLDDVRHLEDRPGPTATRPAPASSL